jgi:hypothetical protein
MSVDEMHLCDLQWPLSEWRLWVVSGGREEEPRHNEEFCAESGIGYGGRSITEVTPSREVFADIVLARFWE